MIVWLAPALAALFLYGIGQGLVKKYIGDVAPARFCLYYLLAKAAVNLSYYALQEHSPLLAPEARTFLLCGLAVYVMDGAGWVLYFESIVNGPITIVGTLSAAYPALTVLFARLILGEQLLPWQYVGVLLVVSGCIGLSYDASGSGARAKGRSWIPLAGAALAVWGLAQTLLKYAYRLPGADEANLALLNTLGGALTLGAYGLLRGGRGGHSWRELGRSFLPMAMMAGGDLGVMVATRYGPVSVVAPLSGAYPLVTIGFAYFALNEKITKLQWASIIAVLVGVFLAPGAS